MRRFAHGFSIGLAALAAAGSLVAPARAAEAPRKAATRPAAAPRIDVCFVLDTTGSMGGLIAGAKRKIWHIANGIVDREPTPRVRFGLVGYRDRGDDYVTKRFDLTENIDAVYEKLQGFEAGGGGDAPEAVNRALHEAVTRMSWAEDRSVTKIIFLVGDAPPHMDYADAAKYPEICELAVKRDLIVNTVQCGDMGETRAVWKEIARRAEGEFAAIGQSGDMRVVETPQDEKLAELNRRIGETLVPYGSKRSRAEKKARQAASERAEAAVAADRAGLFAARAAPATRPSAGGADLTELLAGGAIELSEIERSKLPERLQEMGEKARRSYLRKQVERRRRLNERIEQLQAERKAYIARQRKKRDESGFDEKVIEWVREQSAR